MMTGSPGKWMLPGQDHPENVHDLGGITQKMGHGQGDDIVPGTRMKMLVSML